MNRRVRASLVGLSAIVLAAACARTTIVDTPPPAPAHVVLDDHAIEAIAELLRMEDSRSLDTAVVALRLTQSPPEIRGRAALAAARTGDRTAIPFLLRAVDDPDPLVRARAAFGLGELADSSDAVISALSFTALTDRMPAAGEAAAALGRIGSSNARPALDSLLSRRDAPRPLLHEALLAAWRLPRDAGTLAAIAAWTSDPDAETRWRAVYALARGGSWSATSTLLGLVQDPDDRVRANAMRGLRAALADSAGVRDRALGALLSAVRDSHPHVRINAIAQLAGYRMPTSTTPVLAAALNDDDANVRVAAAQALQQSADPAAAGALVSATGADHPDGVRTAALHALMRSDTAIAARVAAAWSDSARWILRMHAARALARAPTQLPVLERLTRDPHYLVAAEALTSVRAADSTDGVRRLYLEQLAASHPLVRAAAVRGFARNVGPADLDVLLQAWDRARQDTIRDAALAVINGLARIRRGGTPVERAFFLRFGAQGAPRDPVVHRAIADSIGTPPSSWGEPAPRINVQPLSFYEGIVRTYVAPVLAGGEPPRAVIATASGEIVLELASAEAPLTVHNFISLIERGYYTGTRWHRVVPNFVIQDGDPRGDGSGGPGYAIRDEINLLRYERGTLGMALSGPDTGGSQFFITHSPQPHLDGGYTIFGRVVAGMDIVDRVVQEDAITGMQVVR